LSRLARRWRVIFVEEPVTGAAQDRLETFEPAPGVQVWRPHVTGESRGFHDDHMDTLRQLIATATREREIADYWLWFYTPMALPLAQVLQPRGIVYDCIEDVASAAAAKTLVQRENALFKIADLVFTGGPSLQALKKDRHPEVHCFPSSVDAAHYAKAHAAHPLHADIPHPRLGYCGVIDERVNLALIDAIAKARPEWNIVMAGPVEGIARAALPRPDNIHWIGDQPYEDVPRIIAGWDVCLLPFSLNDATRCICPAQVIEHMACGRPSVSTSIRDIVELHGHAVRIADTPEGFIADAEMLMARSREEKESHARQLADVVASTSWDATAEAMAQLVEQADDLIEGGATWTTQPRRVPEKRAAALTAQGPA
jgi:glycosyltransferase involved in cell wall biosynthesis